jgi:hypothetical protein
VSPRDDLDGCRKSRPPFGFDPRTFQPVTRRYTDAIPVRKYNKNKKKVAAAAAEAAVVVAAVAAAE